MKEWEDYVLDLEGKQVVVGDRVAYAAIDGRSANMRIGSVVEIRPKHERFDSWDVEQKYGTEVPCKVRISVEKSAFAGAPEKPVLIQADFKRFVKLG
jgi:hypothetical protein